MAVRKATKKKTPKRNMGKENAAVFDEFGYDLETLQKRMAAQMPPKGKPKKLYHGTSFKALEKILDQGLSPRGKKKSRWEQYPSRGDMVYLTTGFPFYFAMNTVKAKKDKCVVFEIDVASLDEKKLHPDEDYVAQVLSEANGVAIADIHDGIRDKLEDHQKHWKVSVENMGNCCYKGIIPTSSITRYCVFEPGKRKNRAEFVDLLSGHAMAALLYKFRGGMYTSLVSWMFGDRKNVHLGAEPRTVIERWDKEFTDRSGIEVFEV